MSVEKFGRYQTEVEDRIEIRERLALINEVKSEKHLEIYGGQAIGMKTYFARPDGLRNNAESALSCR